MDGGSRQGIFLFKRARECSQQGHGIQLNSLTLTISLNSSRTFYGLFYFFFFRMKYCFSLLTALE
jgi:hypothetical protein